MGCTASVKSTKGMERTISLQALKAAILIQCWFRRHQARLEARGRCTWKIFQAIEYVGEQDQIKLCNFFNELIRGQQGEANKFLHLTCELENQILDAYADPLEIKLEVNYEGPQISVPINLDSIWEMVHHFQGGKVLHVKHVLFILLEAKTKLMELPNIRRTTTSTTRQITVCGDLHGSFDDLMTVFQKNGAPSFDNPYIFNGDLVDRGTQSMEVILIVFSFFLLYANRVYINRGNHEDYVMNARYGFYKEIMTKYKDHASKIVRVLEDVFSWLPLATIIDDEILVVHGGVSDKTDLEYINSINRRKYISLLKPSFIETDPENVDFGEWQQILDLMWSDPCSKSGCTSNTFRGGGCYFGPDVTNKILEKHHLKLLVRSHECVVKGYEPTHGGKVVTVFSASNYYEKGSNNGAYMRILPNVKSYFVEYSGTPDINDMAFVERVSKVEESALGELRKIIISHKDLLLKEFGKYDCENSGLVTVREWINVMETVLKMPLPWNMIKKQISVLIKDGKVDYKSFLNRYYIEATFSKKTNLIENLYRHRNTLETIFRIIDKNNSGGFRPGNLIRKVFGTAAIFNILSLGISYYNTHSLLCGLVSVEEFQECCEIFCQHTKSISKQDIKDLTSTIDINNDGNIDFNEFLEAFRLGENTSIKQT